MTQELELDCLDQLEATPAILRGLMCDLSVEDTEWKPAPDRFSVAEVLAHLSQSEGHCYRTRVDRFVSEELPEFEPDLVLKGEFGRMVALQKGEMASVPSPSWGERAVPFPQGRTGHGREKNRRFFRGINKRLFITESQRHGGKQKAPNLICFLCASVSLW